VIIIASWADVPEERVRSWKAKRVFVDQHNRIRE
jgi:aspartate 1-decarboxylase